MNSPRTKGMVESMGSHFGTILCSLGLKKGPEPNPFPDDFPVANKVCPGVLDALVIDSGNKNPMGTKNSATGVPSTQSLHPGGPLETEEMKNSPKCRNCGEHAGPGN